MKTEQTTRSGRLDMRWVILATAGASLLMLLFGLSHRVLASWLSAPRMTAPIAPDMLERLPMRIVDWTGESVPLDKEIVRATDTDAHVNRQYSRGGTESVSAYVTCGVRTRDMMVHRPEVCYTGAGWTRTGRHSRELPLSGGATLPCTVFEFSRGALNTTKITVLYYYIVDGEYCRDLSDWQYRFWRIGYIAQVHIAASSDGVGGNESVRIASDFAVDSAPEIMRLFDALKSERADSSDRRLQEKGQR